MSPHVHAFLESAAETFELCGPIYEFSYCREGGPTPVSSPGGTAGSKEQETKKAAVPFSPFSEEESQLDRLEDLGRLPFPDRAARTVVCIDALEHVFQPHQAMKEMHRILTPGGMLLVCSAVLRQTPEPPAHYWQPTPQAIQRLLGDLGATLIGWVGAQQSPHTVFGIGCKAPVPGQFLREANRFLECFQSRLDQAADRIGWRRKLARFLAGCVQSKDERRRARDYNSAHFILHLPVDQQLRQQLLGSCLPQQKAGTRLDLSQ